MTLSGLVAAGLVPICWVLVSVTGDGTGSSAAPRPAETNSSRLNSTGTGTGLLGTGTGLLGVDSSMIQRALYVLIGITIIGVLYFLFRAVRLKKPLQKKKYGLLSDYDDSVEMMETMESDEDDTLYEARSLRR
ncbi:protein FAM174C [Scomber japonicus]|uniref:protein FAM174C n=1 Tax=Scomber japonicus TaxID=13676 RepID=UPI0023057101|nr:protein FAM174C [Scomber japonicus]